MLLIFFSIFVHPGHTSARAFQGDCSKKIYFPVRFSGQAIENHALNTITGVGNPKNQALAYFSDSWARVFLGYF